MPMMRVLAGFVLLSLAKRAPTTLVTHDAPAAADMEGPGSMTWNTSFVSLSTLQVMLPR